MTPLPPPPINAMNRLLVLPVIDSKGNLNSFVKILLGSSACFREYNLKQKVLKLIYMNPDNKGLTVIIELNAFKVILTHFQYDKISQPKTHQYNNRGFRATVNPLLTAEELDQERAVEQQEQERKDALKKAHELTPRICGGVLSCHFCFSEISRAEIISHSGGT